MPQEQSSTSLQRRRLALGAVTALLSTSALATNGYFAASYGIKADGVAGAAIAFPQDSLAIATNPAGLLDVADSFDVGLDVFVPRRSATLVQGGTETEFDANGVSTFYIPNIGFAHRLGSDIAVGVAVYGNGGLDTDYSTNPFGRFGASGEAGVDLEQAFLAPAVAYRPGAGQTLGLAVNIGYQRFKAKGIGLFGAFSSDPGAVSNHGYEGSTGAGVHLGWSGHFGPYVTLGATWQSKTSMQRFRDYEGLFADHGGFDVPSTYGVGIAVTPDSHWTVAFDWQKIDYADVPSVGDSIASLFAGVPLGAEDGPGFGWRNVSVFKLGAVYRISDQFSARAGISSNHQPIPASQTFFNILAPGVVETHVSVGGTWDLDTANSLNVSYQHAFQKTINGSGSIPTAFGGGEANLSLAEDVVGFGYSHRF